MNVLNQRSIKETIVMKLYFVRFLMLLFVIPLLSEPAPAQDSLTLVLLSPRVGAVIDAQERDYFNLFPLARTFDSAVVLRNSRGDYGVVIMRTTPEGRPYDTVIVYNEPALCNIASKINHLEEIKWGTFRPDGNFAPLLFGEQGMIPARARLSAIPHEDLKALSPSAVEYHRPPVKTQPGLKTRILTVSGGEFSGELLSVRQAELLLLTRTDAEDDSLPHYVSQIKRVPVNDIAHLHVDGQSRVIEGMGGGFALGAVMGGGIGFLTGDDESGFIRFTAGEKALIGGIAGGAFGLIIGTIAGISSSRGGADIDHPQQTDLADLKSKSRFPYGEPLFLEKMKEPADN